MKLVRTRPSAAATPALTSDASAAQVGPRHVWKLLVVDDEPDVRALTP